MPEDKQITQPAVNGPDTLSDIASTVGLAEDAVISVDRLRWRANWISHKKRLIKQAEWLKQRIDMGLVARIAECDRHIDYHETRLKDHAQNELATAPPSKKPKKSFDLAGATLGFRAQANQVNYDTSEVKNWIKKQHKEVAEDLILHGLLIEKTEYVLNVKEFKRQALERIGKSHETMMAFETIFEFCQIVTDRPDSFYVKDDIESRKEQPTIAIHQDDAIYELPEPTLQDSDDPDLKTHGD